MACGEHQGVVGLFRMFSQRYLGYRRCGSGEVDVVEVVLIDPVSGDHDQIADAKRNHLRRPDFGYPVAYDASGQPPYANAQPPSAEPAAPAAKNVAM